MRAPPKRGRSEPKGRELPEGCRLLVPGVWLFGDGSRVEETSQQGARKFRCEDAKLNLAYRPTRAKAFAWVLGEEP